MWAHIQVRNGERFKKIFVFRKIGRGDDSIIDRDAENAHVWKLSITKQSCFRVPFGDRDYNTNGL